MTKSENDNMMMRSH